MPRKEKKDKKEKRSKKEKKEKRSKKEKKEKKEKPVVDKPVVEEAPAPKKRTRRVVNKESILADFDKVLESVTEQIELLRSAEAKSHKVGVKYLRSLSKNLRILRNDSNRTIKVKKPSNRSKNTQSGFMKPVSISEDMASFCSWDKDVPKSRVDVTKYICNYIKENDLQNPKDRRIIVPDNKLKALLDCSDDGEDLTYYTLQKKIQPHFTK